MRVQFRPFIPSYRPIAAVPRSISAARVPLLLKLIAFVIFLPEELSFWVFGFRLSCVRLVLFLSTPILLVRLTLLLASRKRHLVASDIFVLLMGTWMVAASALIVDLQYALHHNAPPAVEFLGSYLATRVMLSRHGQATSFVNLLCRVIVIVSLLGVPDALMGWPVTRGFLQQLTGYTSLIGSERRLGITRAFGPLEHPILFGTACTIGLLLAVGSPIRAKRLTIGACGLGAFLSLSGAPIQGAFLGVGLLGYDRILARVRHRWWLLIGIVALGYGAAHMFSSEPLAFMLTHLLFDGNSYWTRAYQWNIVGQIALGSPWVGIGQNLSEEARSSSVFVINSVDSVWLYQALNYGVPSAILLGLSMISVVCYGTSGRGINLSMQESKLAATISVVIVVIILLGFTVDLWGSTWMLVGLLIGVRAHLADLGRGGDRATLMPIHTGDVRTKKHRLAVRAA